MDPELKNAFRKLAVGRHPDFDWPLTASHVTYVEYVGIKERKGAVRKWVIFPPHIGEHIRWMKFSKGDSRCQITYYEVVQVQWDVRDARHYYLYRPGEDGEGYLTVFVRPVKNSPGEAFDRAQRAEEKARQRRRQRTVRHKAVAPR